MIAGACHCGKVTWRFDGMPDSATACNCTVCRRYGTLWAYDFEGERIQVSGPTRAYSRGEKGIGFHFCETCGGLAYWRAFKPREEEHEEYSPLRPSHLIGATVTSPASASRAGEGRRRIAVNLRLAMKPDDVAAIPIRHLDGLESWKELRDGRTVGDMWF
jgi:hypothetical protein